MVCPGEAANPYGTRHSPRDYSGRISVVEQERRSTERRRTGSIDFENGAGPSLNRPARLRRHPASASSAGSGFGAAHSLPHLMHLRYSPRALVDFISAPT